MRDPARQERLRLRCNPRRTEREIEIQIRSINDCKWLVSAPNLRDSFGKAACIAEATRRLCQLIESSLSYMAPVQEVSFCTTGAL